MNKNLPNSDFHLVDLRSPWDHNVNSIWLASTLKICRNVDKFKFPHKLDLEQKKQILSFLLKAFDTVQALKHKHTLLSEELTPTDKEFVMEHFLLFDSFHDAREGSCIGFDETGEFITLFNYKDHILLQRTDISSNLEKCFKDLVQIENVLAKELRFAFSEKFGFLTADHFHCGTGLIVSAYLHVPALIHTDRLIEALEKEKSEAILATGMQGNPDELLGDLLMIRNQHTLGVNDEGILTTVRNAVLHLVLCEKNARGMIKKEKPIRIKDSISRAIGLLKYSYQLEVPETLKALSLIKLGIELDWISPMNIEQVNRLFFDCRRSHLKAIIHKPAEGTEVMVRRAEYMQKEFEKVEMKVG